jgi:hypothetical protein
MTRSYDPAFAEDDANIVLRSADSIYYRVPSYTLRTTSGFFRGMMTLPQINNEEDVIVLDETSKVLGTLLRMIGGLEFPKWQSFDDLDDLLNAAEKYDMPGPRATMRAYIITPIFLEQPLRLYAIAARYGWEEEAKLASKHTLSLSIHEDEHAAVLGCVPSPYLFRLFRLHHRRRDTFRIEIQSGSDCFEIPGLPCGCGGSGWKQMLKQLADSMVLQMYCQPSGQELLDGAWKVWPTATARACPYCPNQIEFYDMISKWTTTCINSLPSTI